MSGQVIDSLLRNLDRVRDDLNERTAELNQATDRLAKLAKLLEQAYQDLGEAQRCRVEETAKLQQQVEELSATLLKVAGIIYDAPELNMANYNEDEVSHLNAATCEAYGILRPFHEAARKEAE